MPSFMKERHIKVEVTPKPGGGYEIVPFENGLNLKEHELVCHKDDGSFAQDKVGHDDLYKEGFHLLLFRVKNKQGAKLVFECKPTDAFWAAEVGPGSESGPSQPSQVDDCEAMSVSDDRKLLVVRNDNRRPMRIGYTLRLVDEQGASFECDPIMGNGNGGFSARSLVRPQASSPMLAGALVATAGALLGGLGYALASKGGASRQHRHRRK